MSLHQVAVSSYFLLTFWRMGIFSVFSRCSCFLILLLFVTSRFVDAPLRYQCCFLVDTVCHSLTVTERRMTDSSSRSIIYKINVQSGSTASLFLFNWSSSLCCQLSSEKLNQNEDLMQSVALFYTDSLFYYRLYFSKY